MSVKVAINGFGRIGRLAFRQMFGAEGYEVVAINDLTSPANAGSSAEVRLCPGPLCPWPTRSPLAKDSIIVDGKTINIYAEKDAKDLPWGELGVDVVLECTGFYTSKAKSSGPHRRRRQEGCHLRSRRQRPADHRLQRKREDPDAKDDRSSPLPPAPPTAWPPWLTP